MSQVEGLDPNDDRPRPDSRSRLLDESRLATPATPSTSRSLDVGRRQRIQETSSERRGLSLGGGRARGVRFAIARRRTSYSTSTRDPERESTSIEITWPPSLTSPDHVRSELSVRAGDALRQDRHLDRKRREHHPGAGTTRGFYNAELERAKPMPTRRPSAVDYALDLRRRRTARRRRGGRDAELDEKTIQRLVPLYGETRMTEDLVEESRANLEELPAGERAIETRVVTTERETGSHEAVSLSFASSPSPALRYEVVSIDVEAPTCHFGRRRARAAWGRGDEDPKSDLQCRALPTRSCGKTISKKSVATSNVQGYHRALGAYRAKSRVVTTRRATEPIRARLDHAASTKARVALASARLSGGGGR